jgi:hypothetical protein
LIEWADCLRHKAGKGSVKAKQGLLEKVLREKIHRDSPDTYQILRLLCPEVRTMVMDFQL